MILDLTEPLVRLMMFAPGFVLDRLFGKPDPWPDDIPDTSPASYPPGYRRP